MQLPRPDAHRRTRATLIGVSASVCFAFAGCAPLTHEARVPAPPLQLLSAGDLDLPADCEPAPGKVYRTNYVVHPDGRVTNAASNTGDGCVERALRAWVNSFRYGAVDAEMPVVIDWIAVTAARGS